MELPILIRDARKHLAAAATVDAVLRIRDDARRLQKAAIVLGSAKALVDECGAIAVHAERQLGEMIRKQKKEFGLNKGGRPRKPVPGGEQVSAHVTLREAGIDRKLSSRAQRLAALSDAQVETAMKIVADSAPITSRRVIDAARLEFGDLAYRSHANRPQSAERVVSQSCLRHLWDLGFAALHGSDAAWVARKIVDELDISGEKYMAALDHAAEIADLVKGEQRLRKAKAEAEAKAKALPPYLKPVE